MNVLIFGGTGLLGSAAAQIFIDRGHKVKTIALPPLPEGAPIPKEMDIEFGNFLELSDEELEKAMTSLLEALEAKGILDDTVIVLAADHHPYFMEDYQMNELAHQELDQFSLYKNNLIIYSSTLKHQSINKPCSTIDVLPTVLNLFGISYDSRLFNGKDILSSDEGLVIFADHSWISDKGSYSYKKREFIGEGSSDYIKLINEKVNNSYIIAKNILQYDYYRLLADGNS